MIIAKIIGGLGNQLFQYAAGKAIAEKNNTTLKLDVSEFANYDLRRFDLNALIKDLSIATETEIESLRPSSKIKRLQERIKGTSKKQFYKEPFFHFDSRFFELTDQSYIQGYFQSEKYFSSIKEEIKTTLNFNGQISPAVAEFAKRLQSQNSVSVHIRRGDYKNQEALKVHGLLPIEYYTAAMNLLRAKLPGAILYLFSDDPESAQNELVENEFEIVSGLITKNHFEDLFLMSHCQHNIIANSSFSWWGAWLNTNPGKLVVAPKTWFANGPKDTQDLLPETWIKL